jgi:hypothetical protein
VSEAGQIGSIVIDFRLSGYPVSIVDLEKVISRFLGNLYEI